LLNSSRTVRPLCCGNEAGSYLRLIDSCITQLKAQGPALGPVTRVKKKKKKKNGAPLLSFFPARINLQIPGVRARHVGVASRLAARGRGRQPCLFRTALHPGGNPGANLKSISHRCHPILVAFVWELTKETNDLPLGCLQGRFVMKRHPQRPQTKDSSSSTSSTSGKSWQPRTQDSWQPRQSRRSPACAPCA